MKSVVKKIWGHIGGVSGMLLIIYSIFAFSTAVM